MKKILIILLVFLSCWQSPLQANNGIDFELPEGFKIDTISDYNFVVERDSTLAIVEFWSIPNLDKEKVKAASDSAFFKTESFELIQPDLEGKADVINKYYDPEGNKYIKLYRHIHNDGITFIYAINSSDDFAYSDKIDNTYYKGLRWYWYVVYGIFFIVWAIIGFITAGYFNKNWPRFIIGILLNSIFFCIAGFMVGWTISLMLFILLLVIGIAYTNGYAIIPI